MAKVGTGQSSGLPFFTSGPGKWPAVTVILAVLAVGVLGAGPYCRAQDERGPVILGKEAPSPPGAEERMSDARLKEEVESSLWWDPYVDSDEIEVEVTDSVVTLQGTVTTWKERSLAERNALNAGAARIENHLEVRFGEPFHE